MRRSWLREAEKASLMSEDIYRCLVEGAGAGIALVDREGRIALVNPTLCGLIGYPRQELIGKPLASFLHPDDRPGLLLLFQSRASKSGEKLSLEFRLLGRAGQVVHVHSTPTILRLKGKTIGFDFIFQDITERKQAEETSRAGEERYRLISELVTDYACCVSPGAEGEAAVEWETEAIARITGTTLQELMPQGFLAIVHPDDRAVLEKHQDSLLKNQTSEYCEFRLITKSGSVKWISNHGLAVRDKTTGLLKYIYYIGQDITERKQAEETLYKLSSRNEAILASVPDIIMEVDNNKVYIWANKAGYKFFGNDVLGKEAAYYFEGEQSTYELVKPLFDGAEEVIYVESWQRRRDGAKRLLAWWCKTLKDDEGNVSGALSTARDITDINQAEAALRQSHKLESIGTLAAGVAHEVNNPINGIMNYAQIIQDRLAGRDAQAAEFAGEIIREGERIAGIVRDLLQFSRQDGQARSPARVEDIVEKTVSLVRAVLRQDQISLKIDLAEGLPPVRCRSQQIQQVLMNLLTNARDALNEKFRVYDENKRIHITARLLEKKGLKWIRLTVEDQGVGIPADSIGRIFDPFFTTKPRDQGTGLGLSISHGIVRDHGGEIEVESEPGRFTRIHIDLPLDAGDIPPSRL
jgi:PAS domain S-box-containing protein